jgi:putative membrane protein
VDTSWAVLRVSASGIPEFVLYFLIATGFAALFIVLYCRVTPQREIALIRAGNTAAAVNLGGALLGFAIPLAKSIEQSHSILDMAVWAAVALVVQLGVFWLVGLIVAHEAKRITEGDVATAAFLAAGSIAAGLLSAACMTS